MNMKKIKGIVSDIYEDFDTLESIIKNRAVAFGLDIIDKEGNKEKAIVVYDKNAVKLGLIKIGEPLTCFGSYSGKIVAIDSNGNVTEDKMFLCIGIMGDTDVDEEELARQGAIRLR
jgi:hypothetical protein